MISATHIKEFCESIFKKINIFQIMRECKHRTIRYLWYFDKFPLDSSGMLWNWVLGKNLRSLKMKGNWEAYPSIQYLIEIFLCIHFSEFWCLFLLRSDILKNKQRKWFVTRSLFVWTREFSISNNIHQKSSFIGRIMWTAVLKWHKSIQKWKW